MSKIKVNSIEAATGSTITIPSGQTLDISSTTLTLPSTVVTTTGTQTLTNKTIGVSQLSGTLPVANGGTGLTTLGSASQVLRVNSGATALEFGTVGTTAGQVIQVVNATYSSFEQITSSSLTNTSLSASITPSSASNKVLVLASFSAGSVADIYLRVGLKRGSTDIVNGVIFSPKSAADLIQSGAITFLDTPNTTSATTYFVACKNNGTGTVNFNSRDNNGDASISTITLMEIKG